MITDNCQRWELGRESRRPAGELIKTSAFDVEPIAKAATARDFVKRHHYASSCSSTAHRFGLYQRGELVGVACFGPPPSMNAHRAVFPTLSIKEAVTLGRLVLLDQVPGNGESWFIARCFELLRDRGIVAIESCADPQPRTTDRGELLFRGHLGIVYQATNGRYIGKTDVNTLRLFPDGTVFSKRASIKLLRGERGAQGAVDQLVRWGAAPLQAGEDVASWLELWRGKLTRTMRHQGNHRYLWCLDKRRRDVLRAAQLPYPKAAA
jgi:hypothetical protein